MEPRLHAGEKPLGIDPGRRRQDDRELVPADPAREVGGTDAPDNGVRDLDEQFVSRDLAELRGGRAKVVDVEHTDGELVPLAVCSRHRESQRLVEHLTVAEPSQAVVVEAAQHGCPSACALERRPRLAGDRLERPELRLGDGWLLGAPEHGQEANPSPTELDRHGDGGS